MHVGHINVHVNVLVSWSVCVVLSESLVKMSGHAHFSVHPVTQSNSLDKKTSNYSNRTCI